MRLPTLVLLLLITGFVSGQQARVNKRWLKQQDTARRVEIAESATPVSSDHSRGGSIHLMPLSFINGFTRRMRGRPAAGRTENLDLPRA